MGKHEQIQNSGTTSATEMQDMSRRQFLMSFGMLMTRMITRHPAVETVSRWMQKPVFDTTEDVVEENRLPTDIVSSEELERRYKTRIHNLSQADFPQNYVELYLRKAVTSEPLFQKLESFDLTLDIVLVDSFTVDPGALTREQYMYIYENTPQVLTVLTDYVLQNREANRQEIEDNRYPMQLEYYTRLQDLNMRRATMSDDQYSVESSALMYFYSRYFRLEPTEEDLRHPNAIHGLFFPREITSEDQRNIYIFLAVRDVVDGITITQGDFSLTVQRKHLNAPRPAQSYPTLEDFPLLVAQANADGYAVQPNGPGHTLRHEFVHENRLLSEPQADLYAVQRMADAGEHMRLTGSDAYYWVVFRTPEGITIT
jgi:hypothetical protein